MSSAYDPRAVEEKWYAFWMEKNLFHADAHSNKKPFCIAIPPPNVTGTLHIGHGLVNTLQDVLTRWKRMCGYEALWVPGTDHAGIATQALVERKLFEQTGKRRRDFPREEFLAHIWKQKEESEEIIVRQLKALGSSCDWSRLAFTMDEPRCRAVRTFFKRLFDKKLIYRGHYLVNWDPVLQTALSDDEVDEEERDSFLWHIRYPIDGTKEFLTVATTRPETLLGDSAVAVHPDDERTRHFIGRSIRLPLTDRLIPIIGDSFVDPTFGSGAVKVTPAHDFTDFEVGQRHNLPQHNILTPDGRISLEGPYHGLDIPAARKALLHALKEQGLLAQTVPHKLRMRISQRSKAEIQPYLSKQWFIHAQPFKQPLIDAIEKKRVLLTPAYWEETYFHWIRNLRDWCISRQLIWGHRIPIWYRVDDPDTMICYDGEGEPPEVRSNPSAWVQDPDVLDTWFSSALWPLSILGWPDKTPDFQRFYPTSVLVTGHDILFFWVARMILAGEFCTHQMPFQEVFLHGLIYGKSYWRIGADGSSHYITGAEKERYDLGEEPPKEVHSKWEKMSKSKGNVLDPLEMIATYGCDAFRLTLTSLATHARQIDLDRRRFEEQKNFANKIWNASRFVLMNLERSNLTPELFAQPLDPSLYTLEDRWILSTLNRTVESMNQLLGTYAFDQAAQLAYRFFWNELCAIYLELVKPVLAQQPQKMKLLVIVLLAAIRLLHPMAPFITEEIFALLKERFPHLKEANQDPYTRDAIRALHAPACMVAPYPTLLSAAAIDPAVEEEFTFLSQVIYAIRNIRAEMAIPPSEKTELLYTGVLSSEQQSILRALTPTRAIAPASEQTFGASALIGSLKIFIPIPESLRAKERVRLEKEQEKLQKLIASTLEKLSQEEFLAKAPPAIIDKLRATLHGAEQQLLEISTKLQH